MRTIISGALSKNDSDQHYLISKINFADLKKPGLNSLISKSHLPAVSALPKRKKLASINH